MQDHITPFYITDSPIGFGAFALRDIRKGEHICTFTGAPLTYEQTIEMGKDESFCLQVSEKNYIFLDAPCKYINHSCEPNCGIFAGSTLVAIRDIPANRQITYDYSTTMMEKHWEMDCKCGARHCRGTIRDFDLLPLSLQTSYIRQGIVQPFIVGMLARTPHHTKG